MSAIGLELGHVIESAMCVLRNAVVAGCGLAAGHSPAGKGGEKLGVRAAETIARRS